MCKLPYSFQLVMTIKNGFLKIVFIFIFWEEMYPNPYRKATVKSNTTQKILFILNIRRALNNSQSLKYHSTAEI